jgi:hypothetical protein
VGKLFGWMGGIAVLGGIGLLVVGLLTDSVLQVTLLILGGSTIFMGAIFVLVGRFTAGLGPESIEDGIPAVGQVLSIRDTGVTINNHNALIKATVAVQLPGQAPYQAEVKVLLGRTQWGAVQPGMMLPILVDRTNPARVAFDPSRPAMAPAPSMGGFGGAPMGAPAFAPGAGATPVQRSAADVIARGVATVGTILSAVPAGMTAGQVVPGLAPHEADDPLAQVALSYQGPSGLLQTQMLLRVPDGKGHVLVAGATVPVRYLPEEPTVATIDWSRL